MQGFGYNKVLFMFMAMFGIWGCFGISEFGRKGDMKLFITSPFVKILVFVGKV